MLMIMKQDGTELAVTKHQMVGVSTALSMLGHKIKSLTVHFLYHLSIGTSLHYRQFQVFGLPSSLSIEYLSKRCLN